MGTAAGNATEAARLAGYKGNAATLAQVGSENLKKPEIHAAIDARATADPHVATRQERQGFWTRVMLDATADMGHRLRASELLARSQGDFIERREVRTTLSDGRRVEDLSDEELMERARAVLCCDHCKAEMPRGNAA